MRNEYPLAELLAAEAHLEEIDGGRIAATYITRYGVSLRGIGETSADANNDLVKQLVQWSDEQNFSRPEIRQDGHKSILPDTQKAKPTLGS